MFATFLGLAILCLGFLPISAALFMIAFDDWRTALTNLPGALLVCAILGFIGFNTMAVEVGWPTIL